MKERLLYPLGMSSAGFGEPDVYRSTMQPWGHFKSGGKWQPSEDVCREVINKLIKDLN
jgi:hypothetical protein